MLLIKNLGLRPVKNRNKTFGIYECQSCFCRFDKVIAEEKRRSILTVCQSCSNRATSTVHGDSRSSLYKRWSAIKDRCLNKKSKSYHNYGGRGILMCQEWQQYSTFKEWSISNGYIEDLTIDRINNDGDYTPSNCRWVDRFVQASNKRYLMKTNTSGVRGAYKVGDKYRSTITKNRKRINLGTFDTIDEAGEAYLNASTPSPL